MRSLGCGYGVVLLDTDFVSGMSVDCDCVVLVHFGHSLSVKFKFHGAYHFSVPGCRYGTTVDGQCALMSCCPHRGKSPPDLDSVTSSVRA